MQKKLLYSLKTLKKFLNDHSVLNADLEESIEKLHIAVSKVVVAAPKEGGNLPAPAEIAQEPMSVALYSDGGCRGNPGPGAWAFVAQNHAGDVLLEGAQFEMQTTNNKMELLGALNGLEQLIEKLPALGREPKLTSIKVVTDSKYLVEGMKTWVNGWKARGWKKADGKSPENLDLWQRLDSIRGNFLGIDWQWVKGHGGHPQNEYCDRLANELMDENLN
ncbi:MAG TPA: ribonuclease H [Bacteriovoracaceae bacterium]|nr:ribonuclease H [Bacteriovoracaceae bacterium]